MYGKLPTIPGSRAGKNENKQPANDGRTPTVKSRKDATRQTTAVKPTKSLPINCSLTVDEMVKEAVNNLIHEYLLKMNFPATLQSFKDELASSRPVSVENYREHLRTAFSKGQRDKFLELWDHFVPASLRMHDKETAKMEFFLTLYFIIYKSKIEEREKGVKDSQPMSVVGNGAAGGLACAIDEFRAFLLKNGEEFSKIDDLLPYYALPFLKEPFGHPLFKELLTDSWAKEIGGRLETVLNSLYSPKTRPYLMQLYEASLNQQVGNSEHKTENPPRLFSRHGSERPAEYTPQLKEESNGKHSFKSFKDKSKTPLMNHLAQQPITDFFPTAANVSESEAKGPQDSRKKTDSPSRAIQVKTYIQRIEADNKRLNELVDLLTKKVAQTEASLETAKSKLREEIAETEFKGREAFGRLLELSETLLQFATMFKAGREHFVETATKKLSEIKNQGILQTAQTVHKTVSTEFNLLPKSHSKQRISESQNHHFEEPQTAHIERKLEDVKTALLTSLKSTLKRHFYRA